MKKNFYLALLWSIFALGMNAQGAMKLTDVTLMHEMRATGNFRQVRIVHVASSLVCKYYGRFIGWHEI